MREITMMQIAEMAGVSIGTVSRVINNKDKVHPKTRQRIQALIDELGYRPSVAAQSLAARRTNNIMLVIPDISDPYFGEMIRNFSSLCQQSNRRMLLGVTNDDPNIECEYLHQANAGTVDGLIVSPLQSEVTKSLFLKLISNNFPTVLMDMEYPSVQVNTFKFNDRRIGEIAGKYLLEKGYERVTFVSGSIRFRTVKDRLEGLSSVYEQAGHDIPETHVITNDQGIEGWNREPMIKLLNSESRPTAIMAHNDTMAIACITMIRGMGLKVPDDIAVIGVGNIYNKALIDMPLTTVAMPMKTACDLAMSRLFQLFEEKSKPENKTPAETRTIDPELIIGETA